MEGAQYRRGQNVMNDTEIFFAVLCVALCIALFAGGIVGLSWSYWHAGDDLMRPMSVIFGSIVVLSVIFIIGLGLHIEQAQVCKERVVQLEIHSHGTLSP
jgi:hypothetical protein